jgi:hypothetical protein
LDQAVSFDLTVLALLEGAGDAEARRMLERCQSRPHPEGELDERIVAFYEELRAVFPDTGPEAVSSESPWMMTPLSLGIDHVTMHLSYSPRSDPAIALIGELAEKYRLALFDHQSSEIVHRR